MKTLEQARQEIDAIDQQMADLYVRRMDVTADVAAWKKERNLPVLDAARERQVIEKNVKRLNRPDLADGYEDFLNFLMAQSRARQQSLLNQDVVAYAGIEGAFAHMVSEKLFQGAPKLATGGFDQAVQALMDHKARYAVVPLENTSSGTVGEVLDLLNNKKVYIASVFDQPIEQVLLGIKGASLKDVEWVYSKDQALAQSAAFLDKLGVQKIPYPNTAMAAQHVAAMQDKTKAAIGAKENAVLYDLDILADHIEQAASNTTRFLVLSDQPSENEGDHFSLVLVVDNKVGALATIIETISQNGWNMDSIQSRPIKSRPFEYFFYIQCEGNPDREQMEACMAQLKTVCRQVRWLGCYTIEKGEHSCLS